MQSSFVPPSWQDDICLRGTTNDYDQASYDKYLNMVHDTPIAVLVVMSHICLCLIITGITIYHERSEWMGVAVLFAAVVLLITIVPIYTVL
jgi:hypothetical protein